MSTIVPRLKKRLRRFPGVVPQGLCIGDGGGGQMGCSGLVDGRFHDVVRGDVVVAGDWQSGGFHRNSTHKRRKKKVEKESREKTTVVTNWWNV